MRPPPINAELHRNHSESALSYSALLIHMIFVYFVLFSDMLLDKPRPII